MKINLTTDQLELLLTSLYREASNLDEAVRTLDSYADEPKSNHWYDTDALNVANIACLEKLCALQTLTATIENEVRLSARFSTPLQRIELVKEANS
jgi:hypothetical protein